MHDRVPGWAADELIERFRGLLLRHRGRIGLTQRQLAERLGVHVRSVQDWGGRPQSPHRPTPGTAGVGARPNGGVCARPRALRSAGALVGRDEGGSVERTLRRDVVRQPARQRAAARCWTAARRSVAGLGEAPDTGRFLGRATELAIVDRWLVEQHARVVQIVGLGGVGTTLLATRAVQAVAPRFAHVFWRTLRHALAPGEWLAAATAFLDPAGQPAAGSEVAQVAHLLTLLRARRCLLVLDNLETLLTEGHPAGRFRPGFETYGLLLEELSTAQHQSCLLVTGREDPGLLAPLVGSRWCGCWPSSANRSPFTSWPA